MGVDTMEVYGTAVVLVALFNLIIGIQIFRKNPHSDVARKFLLATTFLVVWGAIEAYILFFPGSKSSLLWTRLSFVPFIIIAPIPYQVAHSISKGRLKIPFYFSIFMSIFLAALLFDESVQGVSDSAYVYELGPMFSYLTLTHVLIMTLGFLLLYSERRKIEGLIRGIHRIDAMLVGLVLTIIFAYFFELFSPLLGLELPRIGSIFSVFTTMGFRYSYLQYTSMIYPKVERLMTTRDALCGARCSLCSSFYSGRCESCAMASEEKKEGCKIYACAREKGISCPECDHIMECQFYAEYREKCPFIDPKKYLPYSSSYRIDSPTYGTGRTIFRDKVIFGDFGLVVGREHPDIFFEEWDLERVHMIWLSVAEEDKWTVSPTDLAKLSHMIGKFIEEHPISCVLFEGFEYLMIHNSFDSIMKFAYSLDDLVVRNKCRFLLSYDSRTLDREKLALLEKELQPPPEEYVFE
jgi:hypothetical protein